MDVLDEIFSTLDLKGALYFRTDFSAPWSVRVPDLVHAARFHLVVQGVCHVALPNGDRSRLNAGDLILIPRGSSHVLADIPTTDAPDLETVLVDTGYDGRGVLVVGEGDSAASTQLVCGHFAFRRGAEHPLLSALPDFLLITAADRARETWLDEILRLITQRIFSDQLGSEASVKRLSEIAFIELIRSCVDKDEALAAVLNAFRDPQIGKALELIHANPGEAWTVDRLATEIGMSRSRFADRFSLLVGVGPMSYLSEWRLQRALSLLDDARCSVQEVASRIGYQSPAAFTRAFAGKFGIPPSEYRRIAA